MRLAGTALPVVGKGLGILAWYSTCKLFEVKSLGRCALEWWRRRLRYVRDVDTPDSVRRARDAVTLERSARWGSQTRVHD
jgi:hypothetical protein